MFGGNVQYEIGKPVKVKLIMNEEMQLPKGKFSSRELGTFIGRKLITTRDGTVTTNKFAHITEVVISLNALDNTINLENGRLSNVYLGIM